MANVRSTTARRAELLARLRVLVGKAAGDGRGLRALGDDELDELGRLHRALSTHLALLRGFGGSAQRLEELNHVLGQSHGLLYGRTRGPRRGALLGQVLAIPETVRRSAVYHALALLLLLAGGVYGYVGAAADPEWALEFVAPDDERTVHASVEELAASLQHGRPDTDTAMGHGAKAVFTSFLWQNNVRVALLAFFLGAAAGVPTVLLLLYNGLLLGVYSRAFHDRGLATEWWAWVLPHGVTELLAIVLLAGGGLWIGRTILAPGERGRPEALRALRPHALRLLVLAFPMLLLAAAIESFVRQSGLGQGGRYAFAVATAVVWAAYLGLVRRPRALLAREAASPSLIERAVPLPADAELLRAR